MAFEAGNYITNEGLSFQVGNLPVQGGAFETARFHRPFAKGVVPVVISHVQTTNDWPFVKTRHSSADNAGFNVALEEVGDSFFCGDSGATAACGEDGAPKPQFTHGTETVGWIAFEPGHGHLGTLQFEAMNTPEQVGEQPESVTFSHPFAQIPRFFGSIATHNGADASQLRLDDAQAITTAGATFYIEEESCIDDESGGAATGQPCEEYVAGNGCHPNKEVVSWLAISAANFQNGNGQHTVGYQTAANTDDASYISARHRTFPIASIGEQGSAEINTGWLTIDLKGEYRSPVVFAGVPSQRGADASVVRIQRFRFNPPIQRVAMNDDGTQNNHAETERDTCPGGKWCFEIALQEAACLDQVSRGSFLPLLALADFFTLATAVARRRVGTLDGDGGGVVHVG